METGTQIILQRMKDNPEEFVLDDGVILGKWEKAMRGYRNILPTEDVEAIDAMYKQMRIDRFNEGVLKTLAGETEGEGMVKYKAKERYATGWSDPRAFANAAVKAEGQMVGYDDHLDAHRQVIRQGLIESIGITTAHKGSSK
jgi:hypothetical protein